MNTWIAHLVALLLVIAPPAQADPASAPLERLDEIRARHWAFQPVQASAAPGVRDPDWPRNEIDRFVLARLEQAGLRPSPEADRRTLIRRLGFDLLGVPPKPDEVEAFVQDASGDAYERLVDRMLASPLYGQRWARHWLDVARYADTQGHVMRGKGLLPFAFTYRDYVVDALNADKSYDRFVIEQLAADRLGLAPNARELAALGFWTVSPTYDGKKHDIIDNRIDTLTRGLLGLTVSCARCHDHKYDPIGMADYYALHGVLDSTTAPSPNDLPLLAEEQDPARRTAYEKGLIERRDQLAAFEKQLIEKIETELRSRVADYLTAAVRLKKPHGDGGRTRATQRGLLRDRAVRDWRRHLDGASVDDPVFGLWRRLEALPREGFAARAAEVAASAKSPAAVIDALRAEPPASMADVARLYGAALERASKDESLAVLRQALEAPGSPVRVDGDRLRHVDTQAEGIERGRLVRELRDWQTAGTGAPARAMVIFDKPRPNDSPVFERGDAARPGPRTPRRFLRVLEPMVGAAAFPDDSSGRLELARAIAHPDNPLTARVIVNRVWGWHMGRHLVGSPSDFGLQGSAPTHPALLDRLAADFVQSGWSLKALHRRIVTSATYRQSSRPRAEGLARDPGNALYWRALPRRLEFEVMRDAMLAVAGRLDATAGGRPFRLFEEGSTRRTLYAWIDRHKLPGVFRTFDLPDPDVSAPHRPRTTVPQQALFAMNHPFVIEQARHVAQRPEIAAAADVESRIAALFRLVLGRPPGAVEADAARNLLAVSEVGELSPTAQLAQALLASNAFLYVD